MPQSPEARLDCIVHSPAIRPKMRDTMQRLILSIAGFAFAVGIAVAAPAQPRYEPKDPPKAPTAVRVDLANTAWIGKYGAAVRTFFFEPDGSLSYRSGSAVGIK